MNNNLFNLNKKTLSQNEQVKATKSAIVQQVNKHFDINDTIALILNVLEENIDSLKDTEHKKELVALLDFRNEIKKGLKGE